MKKFKKNIEIKIKKRKVIVFMTVVNFLLKKSTAFVDFYSVTCRKMNK